MDELQNSCLGCAPRPAVPTKSAPSPPASSTGAPTGRAARAPSPGSSTTAGRSGRDDRRGTAAGRSVACADVPDELLPDAGADKEVAYPVPADEADEVDLVRHEDRVDVVVTARTLLRDLLLQADRLAPTAIADRGLVTLLPGQSVTIGVRGWTPASDRTHNLAAVEAALFAVEPA